MQPTTTLAFIKPTRLDFPDLLRGLAVLAMLIFHFCYDLDYFGIVDIPLTSNLFWLLFQKTIVITFVLIAGISLGLASRHGIKWPNFWRRELVLAGCATLVSGVSYWLFPSSWIFFGILHFMALASVLALPFLKLGKLNILLGGLVIALPWLVSAPIFEISALHWLGLNDIIPNTRDYTPIMPWFGLMLMGLFWGRQIEICKICLHPLPHNLGNQALQWLGRHSLAIYMLHQPLLFAAFSLIAWFKQLGVIETLARLLLLINHA